MKEYNPGNLCGQGLRTFSEEHALLNKWMTVASEKVAEKLEQILTLIKPWAHQLVIVRQL